MSTEIIYLFAGILLGGAVTGLFLLMRNRQLDTFRREKATMQDQQLAEVRTLLSEKEKEVIGLNRELSGKEADLRNLEEKLKEQKGELENIREKFNLEFRNLANEILEEKSRRFTEQNKLNLNEILKPLGEKIREFEKKVENTHLEGEKGRASLFTKIRELEDLNRKISDEANNLVKALKGESKVRGNWGEIILESILEKSGLVRDREYFIQPSFNSPDGTRLQPDVVVKYPGDRSLVIDSKVSLNAYERFVSSDDEEEKEKALKDHMQSVKNHIRELGEKNYQDILHLNTVDFVMLFMPVEPAYLLVIQNDQDLWSYAYDRRILLISPTNLIAALKMVATLWRQEYQNKNAQEIAEQGGALYDKFVSLLEDLNELGKKLEATQKTYNESMNKLSTGKGNLIKRAENIRKLGAKTRKILPHLPDTDHDEQ